MITGGDKFDFSKGVSNVVDTAIPIRDALVKELKENTSKNKPLDFKFEQMLVSGDAPTTDQVVPDNGGTTTPGNGGGTTAPGNGGGTLDNKVETGKVLPETGAPVGPAAIILLAGALVASGVYLTKRKAA